MATNMNITGCCNSDTLPKSRSLSLRTAAIEQLRQLGKIDRHLPRLIRGQKAGASCSVRVGSTVEHAKLHPSGILDAESALDLDDPPPPRQAVDPVSPCAP